MQPDAVPRRSQSAIPQQTHGASSLHGAALSGAELHGCREVEVASWSHPVVDATYLAIGPDELRRRAADGDEQALFELARAMA
jgi:hypothetical protein